MLTTILAATALATTQDTPPNIILIYSDDHARAAISAYRHNTALPVLIETPNIDRIAKGKGILFRRHYSTNPLCAPSRAAVLTGKYSHLNGHKDNTTTFDQTQQTFPKILQANGYETAIIGKWHLVSNPEGFDYWDVLRGQGLYYNPLFISKEGEVNVPGYTTEITTDKALTWLKQPRQKPFFLMVGHKAPHRNWIPNTNNLEMFEGTTFPEPPTLRTDYKNLASPAKNALMRIDIHMRPDIDLMVDYIPKGMTPAQEGVWKSAFAKQDADYKSQLEATNDLLGVNYQRYMKNYLRCVADIDNSVGELLDYLKANDLDNHTIVIYSSDQGFFLGENGWYDKRFFYEPSAGTPLIINDPRAPYGYGPAMPTTDVDLAPTILTMAGFMPPSDMQGHNILDQNPNRQINFTVYGHFYESDDPDHKVAKYVAASTLQHKIICYYEVGEWELFDLWEDPNETTNRYNDPKKNVVMSEMRRKLFKEMLRLKEHPDLIGKVKLLP